MASSRPGLTRRSLIGAILTGGSSRRYGTDKVPELGPRVLAALREAGLDPIVAIGGEPGRLPIPTVADRHPGEGPLGGVATALTYARTGWVFVVPCDHVLLQAEHLAPLVAAVDDLEPETAAVAVVDGEPQPSIGVWPAAWAQRAHRALRAGERRLRATLDLGPWIGVELIADALVDADDQATARHLRSGDGPEPPVGADPTELTDDHEDRPPG